MGKIFGIIFSSLNNNTHSRLTAKRTVAAIPFGCRYRLIDFSISNLVNAGIYDISVVANYNYRSLVEHLGSGKDFDLARRSGGINFVSPYQYLCDISNAKMFSTHLEALKNMYSFIVKNESDDVVLMDSDTVLNIDLKKVIKSHEQNCASITFVTKQTDSSYAPKHPRMLFKTKGTKITDIAMSEQYLADFNEMSLGILVIKRLYLKMIIEEAIAHRYTSLTSFILKNFTNEDYHTYLFEEYSATVSGFNDYFKYSMELLENKEARAQLFNPARGIIYTKIHNSSPKHYKSGSNVKNSMLADESVIEGTVLNSIIFRGVRVEKGARVENSILFHGTHVAKGAKLNYILTDKDVYISEGTELSGNKSIPFYIEKGRRV